MITRCKFTCTSVTKSKGWQAPTPFVYEANFLPVTSGSEENLKFYASTPGGSLKISIYKDDVFEVGAEYFIDISKATWGL